ncbi:MAG: Cytochrome c assembly protein [uncultured Thiotrichaceae bacterium]|uniref:Cytochrome c assembly protein n=1 Tax=uncultured Thiotrichaceae bacterium TaxID=298394 RepID=A0A6S6SQW8_9GAMM|nr:MAG: Cytochrome c assembly protein [uncultured Thiotrichaceae bacterium]
MTFISGYLALFFYLTTIGLIAVQVKSALDHEDTPFNSWIRISWISAIVCHAIILFSPLLSNQSLHLDFFTAASHVAWITSLLLLITTWSRQVHVLGLIILPLAVASLIASHLNMDTTTTAINGPLATHILLSLLGYSFLFLATLQALLVRFQNQHLHNHKPGGIIRALPSLQDMEHLLFRLLLTGTLLLYAGLVTGFIFLDDLFGQHVLHKTVLTIIALAIYTTLLLGHWKFGWRGKLAVKWTLIAFALLILAYFGSKFVYEFLLR